MAAFSYTHQPNFLLDSIFFPNTPTTKVSGFMEENIINSNCFSDEPCPKFHETSSCIDYHYSSNFVHSDNEPSVTKKQSTDNDSSVVEVTQDRKRRTRNGNTLKSAQSNKGAKEGKNKKARKCNIDGNMKNEKKECKLRDNKKDEESPSPSPSGYIHVRARRGQATDSHSLAERVRREKISERMKILQRLVPGCDKVTGKALMLDEIINYVQSLQNQVEFLSMKLASFNPIFYDFEVDLETLMVRPDQRMNGLASPLQQCNPTEEPTAFVDITTTAHHNYPLLDASPPALLQQGQIRPNVFTHHPQDNGSLLWDGEDQRQKLLVSSGLNHNLCSFH